MSGALSATGWAAPASTAVEEDVRHPSAVDLTLSGVLTTASGVQARVRASFVEPGAQWLQVRGEEARLELPGDTYSARDVATELRVGTGGQVTVESFAPVDPYELMVEAVSAAVSGGGPGGAPPFLVLDRLLGVGGAAPRR